MQSYFTQKEGFLSGLSFSSNNITLNTKYEEILKFYGYDITSFNKAVDFNDSTKPIITTTSMPPEITSEQDADREINVIATSSAESKLEESEEITTMIAPTSTAPTTTVDSQKQTTQINLQTETPRSDEPDYFSAQEPTDELSTLESTLSSKLTSTSTSTSTVNNIGSTEKMSMTTTDGTTSKIDTVTSTMDFLSTTTLNSTEIDATPSAEEFSSISSGITATATNTMQDLLETTQRPILTTVAYADLIKNAENISDVRDKRSVVDYIIARYYDEHAKPSISPLHTEQSLSFLVGGKLKENNISYMLYDTILPFHYLQHLNTLALRLPLENSRFYLLILLPKNYNDIGTLITNLRFNTNLQYIIDNLKYTYVKAFIPSFILKGSVVLTDTFQKVLF